MSDPKGTAREREPDVPTKKPARPRWFDDQLDDENSYSEEEDP